MKIDWDTLPIWPFYTGLYVLAAFVVTESLETDRRGQCDVGSRMTIEQRLLLGAAWPVTVVLMMPLGVHPLACLGELAPAQVEPPVQ